MPASSVISKAVIPAAGHGTRMQPLSCALPKELLPVGNAPMIHYAVCEAVAAGVSEIYVIIDKRRKTAIEEFYRRSDWRSGEWSFLCGCDPKKADECDLIFLDQPNPLGIVDAIDKARDLLAGEPFFLLMPDNVGFGRSSACIQLRDAFLQQPRNILGLTIITRATAATFSDAGGVELTPLTGRLYRITALLDKSRTRLELGSADRILRICGRYVLTRTFFEEAEKIAPEELTQKDEIPVLRRLLETQQVLGLALESELYDCGNWSGYWAANSAWRRYRTIRSVGKDA